MVESGPDKKENKVQLSIQEITNYALKREGYTIHQRSAALGVGTATISRWDKKALDSGIVDYGIEIATRMVESGLPAAARVVLYHLERNDYQAAKDILITHRVLKDRKDVGFSGVPDSDIDTELISIAREAAEGGDSPDGEETATA